MATTITGTTIDVGPNKLVANSAGNVGVGTASPSGLAKTLNIDGGSSGASVALDGGANFAVMYTGATAGDPTSIFSNTGFKFATATSKAAAGFTERMRIDADGIVTKPYQPAFLAYPTARQTNIAVGTSTIVLNAERFDQGGDFNTGTSTFTAPVTGKYQFNLNVRIGATLDTAANYYRTYIKTSNFEYYPAIIDPNFTADLNYYHLCFSVLADMDAGDTAYAAVQQSGGAVQTDIEESALNTNFSGYLVA